MTQETEYNKREQTAAAKVKKPKTKKTKIPKIVCIVDGELKAFKNEDTLKSFMFRERVETVIRYDLSGKVSFPVTLETKKI